MESNVSETISAFSNFFESNYQAELSQASGFIEIPFIKLLEWNPETASELLENPEEILKMAELAVENLLVGEGKNLSIRFTGLPKTQQRSIWEIRKEDVGKFIALSGIINKASGSIDMCTKAKFECGVCGNITNIQQSLGYPFKEPTNCGCGRKGKMTLIDKEITNIIKIGLIDDLMARENIDRSIAREKLAILSKDLTSHKVDKMIKPGKKVLVNGYFKYIQKSNSVEFDSIFYANSIEFVKVGWDTIRVNKAEEEEITKLAKQEDIIPRLAESIADVEGFSEAKVACLLMLAGAPHKYDENGHLVSRGTTHILLIGNPGGGKTFLAKRAGSISPIYSFASAATASGKGLVAAVSQDKDIGAWVIYPGVVAMASKGVCVNKGTLIYTPKGFIPIQNLKIGNAVYSFEDYKFIKSIITKITKRDVTSLYNIILLSGKKIEITGEHPVAVFDNGLKWKKVNELSTNDYLITPKEAIPGHKINLVNSSIVSSDYTKKIRNINQADIFYNKAVSITKLLKNSTVYNLEVNMKENPNYVAGGIVVHNCVIDEIDKTHKDDYGDHNNAMNDMLVILAKANVKGKLETETSYLATANPENRVFTEYDTYANQIDMPKDFQDRFDLILPMVSPTDKVAQEKIMDIMLERHTDDKSKKSWNPEFTHNFIQKYIAYCRKNNPNPILSPELFTYIKKKLIELMRPKSEEQSMISFRHLESVLRFAYESARLRLRDVTEEDVDLAFNLKKKSFIELGIISQAGGFSWAKLENIEEKVISEKEIIHGVLREMIPDSRTEAEWQEIIKKCVEKGIKEDIAEEHIQKLITKGDYFEPRRGYIRRIP